MNSPPVEALREAPLQAVKNQVKTSPHKYFSRFQPTLAIRRGFEPPPVLAISLTPLKSRYQLHESPHYPLPHPP